VDGLLRAEKLIDHSQLLKKNTCLKRIEACTFSATKQSIHLKKQQEHWQGEKTSLKLAEFGKQSILHQPCTTKQNLQQNKSL